MVKECRYCTRLKFREVDPEIRQGEVITQSMFDAALDLRRKRRRIDCLPAERRHINGLEWL
jgi:hypothetical protein